MLLSTNEKPLKICWLSALNEVDPSTWNRLALPLKTPFLEWEWLENLERSGSIQKETGWEPHHLAIYRDSQLIAAAPLYLKTHSMGEFVFDHQVAEWAYRNGMRYYPKLVGMTPLTPVAGYRFLIAPEEDEEALIAKMLSIIDEYCIAEKLSGCHFLFVDDQWAARFSFHGYAEWMHHSYIWKNHDFHDFDDYLKIFDAHQRKNIRRERRKVTEAELKTQIIHGEMAPHLFRPMFDFYESTCDKFSYWGSKYLTPQFFENLATCFSHRVVFAEAKSILHNKAPLAMSLLIHKEDQLYGRYWGCNEEYDALHFELCYYTPIDWCIQSGVQLYDPGAGGSHKKKRGFAAVANRSFHRYYFPLLKRVFEENIMGVNREEQQKIEMINQDLGFAEKLKSSF